MASDIEFEKTIVIESRFSGPPNSGNGGYVCGLLAGFIEGPAEITLRKPPPLDRSLRVEVRSGQRLRLLDGEDIIAEGQPIRFDLELPPPPSFAEAQAASENYVGFAEHEFANCFVCGPLRAPGNGLRIFAGAAPGKPYVAAPWVPEKWVADDEGPVKPEFLWATLDCPGYFAIKEPRNPATLLARMAAEIKDRPRVGAQTVVIGWEIAREGRKHFTGTAMYSQDGKLHALAKGLWIELQGQQGYHETR